MKAVVMDGYGGTDVLRLTEMDPPLAGTGEILIRVRAIGVNPADTKWRSGMFAGFAPLNFPHIPGYDVAGEVTEPAAGFPMGTRVAVNLDSLQLGAYAEFAVARAADAALLPDDMAFETAAAVPTPGLTGVQMIEAALNVQPGQTVLVTGAAGAVGRFAMFAARARGVHIVAAVRAAQRDEARALGAAEVLVLGEEDWHGRPFNGVADTVGGGAVAALCRHVPEDGMLITVSTTPIPADGLSVAPKFMAVHPDSARLTALLRSVAHGDIAVPIAKKLRLADAAEAQRLVEAGGLRGKVILQP